MFFKIRGVALIFSCYEANEHSSQQGPEPAWRRPLAPVGRPLAGPQQRHGKRGPRPAASAPAQRLLGNITGTLWNELTEPARGRGSGSPPATNLRSQKNKDGGGRRQHHPPGGADGSWTPLSTGAAGLQAPRGHGENTPVSCRRHRVGVALGQCPVGTPATHSAGLCQGPAKHPTHPVRETVTP